ncbi:hypothetical protein [Paenirhodobacter enshiensis]|uniref:hypothetical protein n=1 Tax=Paenirhodobacter enshiensis TaxID=1105367 RepID=UPI0035B19B07
MLQKILSLVLRRPEPDAVLDARYAALARHDGGHEATAVPMFHRDAHPEQGREGGSHAPASFGQKTRR